MQASALTASRDGGMDVYSLPSGAHVRSINVQALAGYPRLFVLVPPKVIKHAMHVCSSSSIEPVDAQHALVWQHDKPVSPSEPLPNISFSSFVYEFIPVLNRRCKFGIGNWASLLLKCRFQSLFLSSKYRGMVSGVLLVRFALPFALPARPAH